VCSVVLITVARQLFAYRIAIQLGPHVDQPRNLVKSVTVE
jgi:glucosamine 6-phosphate synthetase-like amidotransferase/phosphosugar isomerase protein